MQGVIRLGRSMILLILIVLLLGAQAIDSHRRFDKARGIVSFAAVSSEPVL